MTRQKINVATGTNHTLLGRIFELPVQFGKLIIPTTAMVMDVDSYDLLLGNDWLIKAQAVIDLAARKLKINWQNRSIYIPLDLERGILPDFEEVEDKEEEDTIEYYVMQLKGGPTY